MDIQKDELIQLHMFLFQLKLNLEEIIDPKLNHFSEYDSLEMSPQQVFKSKKEHQVAIFELSKGISSMIKENNPSIY